MLPYAYYKRSTSQGRDMPNTTPADGHQQSIGADSATPVDGIAGSHPGTQQPSGAHVDAGGPVSGPARQRDAEPDAKRQGHAPKTVGMSGRGVAQPAGAVGMMGSVSDDGADGATMVFQQQRRKALAPSRPHSSGR